MPSHSPQAALRLHTRYARFLLVAASTLAALLLMPYADAATNQVGNSAGNPVGNAAGKIPRGANGKPDFSGFWQSLSAADYDLEPHAGRPDAPPGRGVVEGDVIPYLPAALEQKKKNFANRTTQDPRLKCFALGVPRQVYYPEPFQIFQRPRDLLVLPQFGYAVRTIHTNGTDHPADPNDWWLGDSRGKWEGDTLVVDVKHFLEDTWLDRAGNHHSDQLHVVERWKYLDANTIAYRATIEDPKVYSRPWSLNVTLYRLREPGQQLIENYCYTHPYDKYYPLPVKD
ncbi:MAG: hypothetical protein QM776_10885 [Rhodocyclaceae bacterium]